MNQKEILKKTEELIKKRFENEPTGHDYWHLKRVVKNASEINKQENGDSFLVELSAWVHDLGDYKLNDGKDISKELVPEFLKNLSLDDDTINTVIEIVEQVSYKGGFNEAPSSIEAKIVQDADRLDAIGAIGIARAFAYGGKKGRVIYNPEIHPTEYKNKEAYKNSNSPTINHFYEKLLKLKDLMNTETGKQLALQRHEFMQYYLEKFYDEVKISSNKKHQ